MAKIYSIPSGIKAPEFNWKDVKQYEKDCEQFKADLKAFLVKRKNGKLVGEVVRFPVADGYAEYMVAGLSPVELIHLPLWDEYQFEYAHLMTAKEIQDRIEGERMLAELFGKKKEA